MEHLPGVQEGGGTHAIGTLEFRDGNPVGQAQVVKCITGLNVVNNPTVRRTTGQWSLDAYGRY